MIGAARRRLFEYGLPMERLLRFPSHQVILLDEKQEYEVRRDDSMKLMNLPIWQVQSLAADMETAHKAPTVFAQTLAEGVYNVRKCSAAGPANRTASTHRSLTSLCRGSQRLTPRKAVRLFPAAPR